VTCTNSPFLPATSSGVPEGMTATMTLSMSVLSWTPISKRSET
jgi:hypothetical protein